MGIAPTRDCIHFLKDLFVVIGDVFYAYHIQQGKSQEKKFNFMHTKKFNNFFK